MELNRFLTLALRALLVNPHFPPRTSQPNDPTTNPEIPALLLHRRPCPLHRNHQLPRQIHRSRVRPACQSSPIPLRHLRRRLWSRRRLHWDRGGVCACDSMDCCTRCGWLGGDVLPFGWCGELLSILVNGCCRGCLLASQKLVSMDEMRKYGSCSKNYWHEDEAVSFCKETKSDYSFMFFCLVIVAVVVGLGFFRRRSKTESVSRGV